MSTTMKIDEAVVYLASRGVRVSRRTVYNWIRVGVRGCRLQHDSVPNPIVTAKDRHVVVIRPEQLESFLAAAGVSA